jgi:flagellar motor switch/type III secretory pathway protein FliN
MKIGGQAIAVVLPESYGLIPAWYAQPDATGESKLNTLAQELALLLLPDATVDEFAAARTIDLSHWLLSSELTAETMQLALAFSTADGRQGQAHVIWPLTNPSAALALGRAEQEQAASEQSGQGGWQEVSPQFSAALSSSGSGGSEEETPLPPYSRNLLRISVPVTVTLAEKRQSVSRIVELGPGSIIQFDKSCDELLDLEVGGHKIGVGEAVKVGDKFGLRLTLLTVPEERLLPLSPPNRLA